MNKSSLEFSVIFRSGKGSETKKYENSVLQDKILILYDQNTPLLTTDNEVRGVCVCVMRVSDNIGSFFYF